MERRVIGCMQDAAEGTRKKAWSRTTQYITSESHKIIFAVNPKVMSTSSKLIAWALDNNGTIRSRIPRREHLTYLGPVSEAANQQKMDEYQRVLFIRNPYARLYSAWTNKYRDMPSTCKEENGKMRCNPFYDRWVSLGLEMYKHAGMTPPEDSNDMLRGVTWEMFLEAVLSRAAVDRHWTNQVWRT
jgi:hypothetical protein